MDIACSKCGELYSLDSEYPHYCKRKNRRSYPEIEVLPVVGSSSASGIVPVEAYKPPNLPPVNFDNLDKSQLRELATLAKSRDMVCTQGRAMIAWIENCKDERVLRIDQETVEEGIVFSPRFRSSTTIQRA